MIGGRALGKQSFARGAVILAAASAISRLLGVVYIIALPRIIRDEGMGLMQMVRPIYSFAVILSVAGLPVALSKLVAEQMAIGSMRGARQVFRWALGIMLTLGFVFTGALLLGGRWLVAIIVRDPLAYPVLMAMTPSIVLLSAIAALRGFFQGMQYMTPSAASQVVEQVGRVGSMLVLAITFMPRGVEYGAAGASLGGALGSLVGLVILSIYYVTWHRTTKDVHSSQARQDTSRVSGWRVLRRLFSLSLPMVLGSMLWPTMQMIDTGLVPLRMQAAGFSVEAIRESLGYLGMALSLMHFPNVLTTALAVTLVPAVAEAEALNAHRQIRHRVTEALRLTMLFGIPSSTGLLCLAGPISTLLFGYGQVAEPLQILAVGTLAVGVFQVCSGILQGLGLVLLPVYSLIVGVLFKLGLNYWLTALPVLGIKGAAWGTVTGFCVAGLLNLRAVSHHAGIDWDLTRLLLKPIVASIIMGLSVILVYRHSFDLVRPLLTRLAWIQTGHFPISNGLATLIAIGVGIGVYVVGLMGTGALYQRDVELIPKIGTKLGKWLKRRGWVQ